MFVVVFVSEAVFDIFNSVLRAEIVNSAVDLCLALL